MLDETRDTPPKRPSFTDRVTTYFPGENVAFETGRGWSVSEFVAKSVVTRLASLPTDSDDPPPELADDKYRVEEEVGRGGMGKVLMAKDNDLNRRVAMKVLLDDDGKTSGAPTLRRFVEEAQITGQLEHPNVLPVHDLGVNDRGELFFTMQYVAGSSLQDVIEKLQAGDADAHASYTWERRVQIIQQVSHALHYAHLRGVVHRDIKPENILIGTCGEVYLVDWGVAKPNSSNTAEADLDAQPHLPIETLRGKVNQTQRGSWIGTPLYMSPEQILGMSDEIDARSDLYGLCAVLYELLSLRHYLGDAPEDAKLTDLVARIVHTDPAPAETQLHPVNGRVPRALSRICAKGLRKLKGDRFNSARELEESLQRWLEGRAPIVCPGTWLQDGLSRWSRWIDRRPALAPTISFTLLGVILLLAGLGAFLGARALG